MAHRPASPPAHPVMARQAKVLRDPPSRRIWPLAGREGGAEAKGGCLLEVHPVGACAPGLWTLRGFYFGLSLCQTPGDCVSKIFALLGEMRTCRGLGLDGRQTLNLKLQPNRNIRPALGHWNIIGVEFDSYALASKFQGHHSGRSAAKERVQNGVSMAGTGEDAGVINSRGNVAK